MAKSTTDCAGGSSYPQDIQNSADGPYFGVASAPTSPPSYDQVIASQKDKKEEHVSYPTLHTLPDQTNNYGSTLNGQPHISAGPSIDPNSLYTQQPRIIIVQNQTILPLGPRSTFVTCPICQVQARSRIEVEPNSRTHLMAALLCILGFWCCACLPYFADSCMNTNHYCSNCNRFLGTYQGDI